MFQRMGQPVGLNHVSAGTPERVAQRRITHVGFDIGLILIVAFLLVLGILMVYSASYDFSLRWMGNPLYMFNRQLLWIGLGLACAVFLAFFDYHHLKYLSVLGLVVTVGLLVVVLVIHEDVNNATRTLSGGSYQPSELAKLITVLYLSAWITSRQDVLTNRLLTWIPLALVVSVLATLIVFQPDVSATLTVVFLGGLLFFLGGGRVLEMFIVVFFIVFGSIMIVVFNPTGSSRVESFRGSIFDPLKASDHVQWALEAFVNGKWFGTGIGHSQTKLAGLPYPSTDSIFAVFGEEFGTVGAIVLVLAFAFLLYRGLVIAHRAPDAFGALLASGLAIWITIEAMINMGVMVSVIPFAGNNLPFISSGGSNMLVTMVAVGILLNISRQAARAREEEGRSFETLVDLRRRDGRRGVSRSRRASGAGGTE